MAHVLPLTKVAASPLTGRVAIEFFVSMKQTDFNPLVQTYPPEQQDMVHFLSSALSKLRLKAKWVISADSSIEPSHPQWFAEVEASGIRLLTTCDLKNETSEADIRTVFGTPTEADPTLYCETNSTAHLMIRVNLDQGRRPRSLEKVRNLAMLVLAFEEEIDKMLADHVGYMNEDAAARSNANNIALVNLPPKQKLQRIWSAKTHQQIIQLMCPDDPSFAHPGWDPHSAAHLNRLYKYNFRGAMPQSSRGRAPVVEFRQHQGTLSATEIVYWMNFVTGLVELADKIADEEVVRLVHMRDVGGVNVTELFAAMANEGGVMVRGEMVDWYTRKVMARGGRTRVRSKLRLGERKAGARGVRWRDLEEGERVEEKVEKRVNA